MDVEAIETAVGVFLVRIGLSVVALVCYFSLMLTVRRLKERVAKTESRKNSLPEDLLANVRALTHQVAEQSQSLLGHINRDSARESRKKKASQDGAAGVEEPGSLGDEGPTMSQQEFAARLGRRSRSA